MCIYIYIYIYIKQNLSFKPFFLVYNSVALITFMMLYNRHHGLFAEHFHHPKQKLF